VLARLIVLRLRQRALALFLVRLGLGLLGGQRRIDLLYLPALLVEQGRALGRRFGRRLVAIMHAALLVGPFVGARRRRSTGEDNRHQGDGNARSKRCEWPLAR